jgi:F-type H+-transporting ATPase subunit delta
MDGSAVVKRYADGFLAFAKDSIGFMEGLDELRGLKGVFRDNPDLKAFLDNPAMSYAEKCATIENVLGKSFSQESLIFIKLLLKKDRIDEFDKIVDYARVKYAHGDEVNALVKASYPLDTDVIGKIKSSLEKLLEKKLHIYMDLDPDLLGGVRAEIEHIVIDGSLKKRMGDLKNKLMAVRVS